MTYLEDSCMLLGMPLLLAFLILCFHYNWYDYREFSIFCI